MRKSVKIICFLFSLNLFAQTNLEPNPELQKTTYIKTIKSIEKPDKHSIMQGFLYSYKLGIDTEIGKLALKKFDSIFETEKEKLIKELQGEWLLKKVGSNWGFDEAKSKKINFI